MKEMHRPHVAIVGAGLSGAFLSNLLIDKGLKVSIYEKSRGTGGRLSSCRLGESSADLGAPFFNPKTDFFKLWLEQQSSVSRWSPGISDFSGNLRSDISQLYTANPRQSALTRSLVKNAELLTSKRVGYIWPERDEKGLGILLRDDHGKALGHYDAAIIATPAMQAIPLLEAIPRFQKKAEEITPSSSWVSILALKESVTDIEIFEGSHPILFRAIKDSAKPYRSGTKQEIWQVEATSDWSAIHQEKDPNWVLQQISDAFFEVIGSKSEVESSRTHRWLYSRNNHHSDTFLWDQETAIGVCGDWLANQDQDGAWHSAYLLADKIINHFSDFK